MSSGYLAPAYLRQGDNRLDLSLDCQYTPEHDITIWETYQIVRCLGCDSISFRSVKGNSEDFVIDRDEFFHLEQHEVYPPRAAGRPKLNDSSLLPFHVRRVYEETYQALCSDLYILAAIGIRALVEAVCAEEEAQGDNLHRKIDSLMASGVLTETGAGILHKVRSIGNTAAHETKEHGAKTLGAAFDVAENLLQNVYILPEKAARLDQSNKHCRSKSD